MHELISEEEFENLKQEYARVNNSFKKKVIFHVGIYEGFFSEVGGMLESIMYCYHNKIKFVLYADYANFSSGKKGWEDFFEPFCELSHNLLNYKANSRHKLSSLVARVAYKVLKITSGADYLTYDIFWKAIGEFKVKTIVDWPEMNIHGTTWPEYHKLIQLAMRFNPETRKAVNEIKNSLQLPGRYYSIQIRGGDKIKECSELLNIDFCIDKIEAIKPDVKSLFVFTDDYSNIKQFREKRPHWNILTLTGTDECGYYNEQFGKMPWEYRKKNLLKLFAMVEICIDSDFHFGCEASVNNIIRACKKKVHYYLLNPDSLMLTFPT